MLRKHSFEVEFAKVDGLAKKSLPKISSCPLTINSEIHQSKFFEANLGTLGQSLAQVIDHGLCKLVGIGIFDISI